MRGIAVVGVPSTRLGRARRHSLTDPDLLAAWYAGAVKRRDAKDLAELAKRSLQHAVDAEVERFEEHLTTDPRSPVDYVEASNGPVAKGTRRVTRLVLRAATSDMNIAMPELGWFRAATEGETPEFSSPPLNGFADRKNGVVWLAAKLTPLQVAVTAAHEAAHMAGRGELDAQLCAAQYDMRK